MNKMAARLRGSSERCKEQESNRTGKLRRSQLTCMVRLLKQYVTMQYVALINSVQEMHMPLSDAFIPINTCTAVVLAMYL